MPFETDKKAAEKVARLLARAALTRGLSDSGVMAMKPSRFGEMVDEAWPKYLYYAKGVVEVVCGLAAEHGLVGLVAEIEAANAEYRATLPPVNLDDF